VNLLRSSMNADWPPPHDVRMSGNESHDDDALKEGTQDRSQIGTCALSHFSDADHAEDESERHEQRSDFVSGVVEIVEHELRSRVEDQDSAR
jgi:hypothetical protein